MAIASLRSDSGRLPKRLKSISGVAGSSYAASASQYRAAHGGIIEQRVQIRHQSGQTAFHQCRQCREPHCFRSLFITSNLPQDGGCLGLSQVEHRSRVCCTTAKSGRATRLAKTSCQPSGGRHVCAAQPVVAPIKRSKQAALSADLSNPITAARPAVGSASTVRRAMNRRTVGIWQTAATLMARADRPRQAARPRTRSSREACDPWRLLYGSRETRRSTTDLRPAGAARPRPG